MTGLTVHLYCASFTSCNTLVAVVLNIFKSCHRIQGIVVQGCRNPGCHAAVATTVVTVVPHFQLFSVELALCRSTGF
jgi:hypothetical protein